MIRKNHVGSVADEKATVHLDSSLTQSGDLLEKGHGIEHDSVSNNAAAAGTKNSARH
jgi:hypothetical protein